MSTATSPDRPASAKAVKWARPNQRLNHHLVAVAVRARRYAGAWGASAAYTAGLWHDLGKYAESFQDHINYGGRRGSVTHSTAGAIHILERLRDHYTHDLDRIGRIPPMAVAMMMAILGHHGKLDRARFDERLGLTTPGDRFPGLTEYEASLAGGVPDRIASHNMFAAGDIEQVRHRLFARMLFSTLVDADRTDAARRKAARLHSVAELNTKFLRFMAGLARQVAKDDEGQVEEQKQINQMRGEMLDQCLLRASDAVGVYALDAPTGFGKTFSSLGFAIQHAAANGMTRIIYVAPFLTAIEQTAAVFRKALNDRKNLIVLEAHSTAERNAEESEDENEQARIIIRDNLRQNWEARVIVTSNVQFLESLHAHDAGRCRKLHRIANSVILIDEPQSIPISLYAPTVDTLRALVADYNTSIVLITATQPAFVYKKRIFPGHKRHFESGFREIRSILPDDLLLRLRQAAANRVNVTLPDWTAPEITLEDVADRVAARDASVLCIVNTRNDARFIFEAVRNRLPEGTHLFHLSASMCSDHRTRVLDRIRALLKAKEVVKVISTQVVEAGIDIDFPVVMRSMGGLDSLIQSAGRCNRHGTLIGHGEFEVFQMKDGVPFMFRLNANITIGLFNRGMALFDPATATAYYDRLREVSDKGEDLLEAQDDWDMAKVGTEYRLIEPTLTVVVPYGPRGIKAAARLLRFASGTLRDDEQDVVFDGLSGVTVSIREKAAQRLIDAGEAERCRDLDLLVVQQRGDRPYDVEHLGLVLTEAEPMHVRPEAL